MAMKRIDTGLPGVCIVEPQVFGDARGYFMETYNKKALEEIGIIADFVQDNQSFTAQKGVLRGIHFQNAPHAQAKLVRVTRGAVMDVAVDLRKGSPTYRQWDVEFCYKVDNLYDKACDRGIRFNDPAIGVDWGDVVEELLSQKDTSAPLLAQSDCNFVYGEI